MRWIPSDLPDKVKALYHSEITPERQHTSAGDAGRSGIGNFVMMDR
ncbi:MAG: hypothetical protein K8L91_21075 [Anaerolineae bacterium]|nr:hypothetical protein [Anaerolineae bacterium]